MHLLQQVGHMGSKAAEFGELWLASASVACSAVHMLTWRHAHYCLQGFQSMLMYMMWEVIDRMQALDITSPNLTVAVDALAEHDVSYLMFCNLFVDLPVPVLLLIGVCLASRASASRPRANPMRRHAPQNAADACACAPLLRKQTRCRGCCCHGMQS